MRRAASRMGDYRAREIQDPWHLLETHCQVSRSRHGKRYKDWLFARADAIELPWVEAIESGLSLLMRTVVREFLRQECSPSFMQSIHAPVMRGSGDISLEDLIPDEHDMCRGIEEAELSAIAHEFARDFFPTLSKTEQALVWARFHGVSFSDPRLQNKTRLGKSVLHETFRGFIERLSRQLGKAHPNETDSVRTPLIIFTLVALGKMLPDKLFSGKPRNSPL